MNYYTSYYDDGVIYTIDMIRLVGYVQNDILEDIRLLLSDFNDSFYEIRNNKIGTFKYNYMYGNCYYGFYCNSPKGDGSSNLVIEFNPNKFNFNCVAGTFLSQVLCKLKDFLFVRRFDLACDIPYKITQLNFENLRKHDYLNYYKYDEDYTIYFGKKDGHTKIYNKTIESSLDYNLTRYEVTKYVDIPFLSDLDDLDFRFLNVQVLPYSCSADDDTLKPIVYALNHGYHFKDLSRYLRSRIDECQVFKIVLHNISGVIAYNVCLDGLRNRAIGGIL